VVVNKLASNRNDSTEHSEHTSQEINNSELLILLSETFKLMYFRADEKYFTKNFRPTLSPVKIWQKLNIKILFFPTTTKRTTNGQSNLIDTKAEGRVIVTKKSEALDDECGFASYTITLGVLPEM
jgi:hypothetical protein